VAKRAKRNTVDLQRMLFGFVGGAMVIVIVGFFAVAWGSAERIMRPVVQRQLGERSAAAVTLIENSLSGASTEVELLANSPTLIAAAERGARIAQSRGLDRLSLDQLERRMAETRSLQVDPEADSYLRDFVAASFFAEAFVTDHNGFVVAASGPTSDFVQSDENWWREAFAGLPNVSPVEYDESAGALSTSISIPLTRSDGTTVGTLKAVLDLSRLRPALAELARGWGYVQVIDERGLLISDPHDEKLLEPYEGAATLDAAQLMEAAGVVGQPLLGMSAPALGGRWTILYWVPKEQAYELISVARRWIVIGGFVALVAALIGISIAGFWITREIARPVKMVADAADRVGGGDLRVGVKTVGKGEVVRLCIAVQQMIDRLRELVGSMREASFHSQSRSQEIAGAVEQLSSGAQEMTGTLARLTGEASQHSDTIQVINSRMDALGEGARDLKEGADAATERSRHLTGLAEESRARLREGHTQVEQMAERSDVATSRLLDFVEASRHFGEFVEVIKQFARRTNLLALNAAIEAARAGGEARGFAVLADEIRKLANQAGEAADRAQETTDSVLGKLDAARQAIGETRDTTHAIGAVVEEVDESFDQVVKAMGEAEVWADRVAEVSADVDSSLQTTADRLHSVASGFSDFAAAMEELAAGMEEQNASTEEIAAAVSSLSASAEELAGLADVFVVDEQSRQHAQEEEPDKQEEEKPRAVHAAAS
jgi:methyl-accepting chemotaxis protein